MNEQPVLECIELSKTYGVNRALDDINLKIPMGKIVGLLGPNGSGKTTLIKLAAGLLKPTKGKILINGYAPGVETKTMVSYLPERPYFNRSMKVSETVDFFKEFYPDFDEERAYKLLGDLYIEPNQHLRSLSKGTLEKVQLILVMSRKAALYLLDEPIGGVDPAARDYILNTVITNYEKTSTILISTHLIADVQDVLDEFIFISGSKVFMQGSVSEVKEKHDKTVDQLFREVFKC